MHVLAEAGGGYQFLVESLHSFSRPESRGIRAYSLIWRELVQQMDSPRNTDRARQVL